MTTALDPRTAVVAFLERVLPGARPALEFPLVLGPAAADASSATIAIEEAGEVRAACAVLVREFRMGERSVRAGLIGSVATDPDWRERGLGTRLLARAEATLAERGCLFALLWADDAGFYLGRGYAPFGVEHDWVLGSDLAPRLPEATGTVRELRAEDVPLLHRLHASQPTRVERSLAEMRALLGVPGMLTLVLVRPSAPAQPALPQAYACLGRGRDLGGAIHEWAGSAEDVLALVRAHLERPRPQESLFLMAPPAASELAYRLVRVGAVPTSGILGLGKIVSPGAAAQLLRNELGAEAHVEPLANGGVFLRGPRSAATIEPDTLLALLFGGPDVRPAAHDLLTRLGFERTPFPLEPFAWGLDSI